MTTENPFASRASLNDFDDLDSDNPFADNQTPKGYNFNPASNTGLDREAELERRERELAAKANNLRAVEDNLKARETAVEAARQRGRNNWPPFYPLIFHDISIEIPQESQPLITRLYQLWLVLLATLIVNMVACIFFVASGQEDAGKDLGTSISYIFLIGSLSFLLWYRPVYNAYMKEQALYYYFYFFFGGFHLLFSLYMVIGIPGTGGAGLICTIQSYARGHIATGIVSTIALTGWVIQGLGNLFYFRQVWVHHNSKGHTFANAKSEFASHGAKAYFTRG